MDISSWIALISLIGGLAAAVCVFHLQRRHLRSVRLRVRIGINRFPDSLPLLYAAQRGFLSPLGVELDFLNWAQAYDYIINGTVDVIFGVKRISAARLIEEADRDLYNGRNLSLYQGFAILLPPNSSTLGWVEISESRRDPNQPIDSVLKDTLQQLEGKTVCVMSWDTRDSAYRLLSYAQVNSTIIVSSNVEDDFLAFASGELEVDAFVGGITQRLLARHFGCKELISEQHVRMGLIEKTGLVWTSLPENVATMIESAWFRAVSEITSDPDAQQRFVDLMNQFCLPPDVSGVKFSHDDFLTFWNRWEIFAADEDQSKRLQAPKPKIAIPAAIAGSTNLRGDNVVSIR